MWLQAARRLITVHDLQIGPIDLTSLTAEDLRRLVTKPFRFERCIRNAALAGTIPRLFRFRERVVHQETVPGGRWLITTEVGEGQVVSVKLYDLYSLDAPLLSPSPTVINPVTKVTLEIQYSDLLQMRIGLGGEAHVCVLLEARV